MIGWYKYCYKCKKLFQNLMRSQCRFYLDLLPRYINYQLLTPLKFMMTKNDISVFLETSYKEYSPYKIQVSRTFSLTFNLGGGGNFYPPSPLFPHYKSNVQKNSHKI